MVKRISDLYGGTDPVDMIAYSFAEAAHYLRIPVTTVRLWCIGQAYTTAGGQKRSQPLIAIAGPTGLSFRNLVELHVLSAIRRKHQVKMNAVRKAIRYLKRQLQISHPFASQEMATDGKDLFIDRYGNLVNISSGGQLEMKQIIGQHLSRIDRDACGLPIRLFPYTRSQIEEAPKSVVMCPTVQFGRPCIAGTGIPTSVIAERYRAGDSIAKLAQDYDQKIIAIEEAIRCEFESSAA